MERIPWNFREETVVVSAGAWGIGRAIVTIFAKAGAKVVFGDVDVLHGQELAAALAAEGCDATFVEADFAEEDAWPSLIRAAAPAQPDILVANAGVSGIGSIEDLDLQRYERIHAVNQRSGLIGAKCVVPHMRANSGGSIVFVGSVMSKAIFRNSVTYVATKSAVEGMTRALATDLAPDRIRVNCVMPGFTRVGLSDAQREKVPPHLWTAFSEHFSSDFEEDYAAQQILPIGADAEDIANTIAFLCSDAARCITGAAIAIDGGLSLPVLSPAESRQRLVNWTEEMEQWVQDRIVPVPALPRELSTA